MLIDNISQVKPVSRNGKENRTNISHSNINLSVSLCLSLSLSLSVCLSLFLSFFLSFSLSLSLSVSISLSQSLSLSLSLSLRSGTHTHPKTSNTKLCLRVCPWESKATEPYTFQANCLRGKRGNSYNILMILQ